MRTLEKQLMRLTLRQLAELVEVEVEASVDDRVGIERLFDVPLRLLATTEFRNRAAFRAFVLRKLEQGQERKRSRKFAAIFNASRD
jgi:hypothetical protein